jgi:hypothetical protein
VRAALVRAAIVPFDQFQIRVRVAALGVGLRQRKGFGGAAVACARKLAVILHRMWVAGSDFIDQPQLSFKR